MHDATPKNKTSAEKRVRRHLLFALVITGIAVISGYKGVLPVFRSHLMRYLDIGDERFGMLFSIGALAGLGSVLYGGYCIDRYGPRRVVRVCLIGSGCAMLLLGLSGPRFYMFALAEALTGFFAAPLFISISAYLAKLFPNQKRRVISLNLASTSLGGMMFPAVAENLLNLSGRSSVIGFKHILHLPFFLIGALLVGSSFIYRPGITASRNSRRNVAPNGSRGWRPRDLWLPPRAGLLAVLIALHGTADAVLYIWMPRFLESHSFQGAGMAPGYVLTGYSMAYLLARGLLAGLPDSVGRRSFMSLPGWIGGSVLAAMILTRSYRLAVAGYVLGAFCWSVEYPAMVSMIMRYERKRFGAVMAVSGLLTCLLTFLAMNFMGIVVQRFGDARMWIAMLGVALIFILVGIGGFVWMFCYEPRCVSLSVSSPSARHPTPRGPHRRDGAGQTHLIFRI